MHRPNAWNELPPAQAGVAAALRCAFSIPDDELELEFEALLADINRGRG